MPDPSPSNADSLKLPTSYSSEEGVATADSSPQAVICQQCDTHNVSRHRTHNRLLVRRATSSATDSAEAECD